MCNRDSCDFRNEIVLIDGTCAICPKGSTPDPNDDNKSCKDSDGNVTVGRHRPDPPPPVGSYVAPVTVGSYGPQCNSGQMRATVNGGFRCEDCPPYTRG